MDRNISCRRRHATHAQPPRFNENIILWGPEIRFGCPAGRLRSDVMLVGEPAEDLLAADLVLGEVDRFWWTGSGLSWGELP